MKYRSKAAEFEAVRWNGQNITAVAPYINGRGRICEDGQIAVETPERVMTAKRGDWLVRTSRGEVYPVKADVFSAAYEPADG